MGFKYHYPKKIDKALFSPENVGEPLYGLPKKVKFCKGALLVIKDLQVQLSFLMMVRKKKKL